MLASELRLAALCCPLLQGKKKGGAARASGREMQVGTRNEGREWQAANGNFFQG